MFRMAYFLRSKNLRERLLEDDVQEEALKDNSSDNISNDEESLDSSYQESSDNDTDIDMDIDMEDPTENQRINARHNEQQRGRPPKHLFGKDGFKWTRKTASRRSGKSAAVPRPSSDCHCLSLSFSHSCSFLTREEQFFDKISLSLSI